MKNKCTIIRFWQEVRNMSLDDCWDNCTEGEEGKIPDEKMLELCGREMNEQELHEVENYR